MYNESRSTERDDVGVDTEPMEPIRLPSYATAETKGIGWMVVAMWCITIVGAGLIVELGGGWLVPAFLAAVSGLFTLAWVILYAAETGRF